MLQLRYGRRLPDVFPGTRVCKLVRMVAPVGSVSARSRPSPSYANVWRYDLGSSSEVRRPFEYVSSVVSPSGVVKALACPVLSSVITVRCPPFEKGGVIRMVLPAYANVVVPPRVSVTLVRRLCASYWNVRRVAPVTGSSVARCCPYSWKTYSSVPSLLGTSRVPPTKLGNGEAISRIRDTDEPVP